MTPVLNGIMFADQIFLRGPFTSVQETGGCCVIGSELEKERPGKAGEKRGKSGGCFSNIPVTHSSDPSS